MKSIDQHFHLVKIAQDDVSLVQRCKNWSILRGGWTRCSSRREEVPLSRCSMVALREQKQKTLVFCRFNPIVVGWLAAGET